MIIIMFVGVAAPMCYDSYWRHRSDQIERELADTQQKLGAIERQQKIILLTACPYDIDPNLIKNVALALQATRPELASVLGAYSEINNELIHKNTLIENKSSVHETNKAQHEARIKLLRNSAVALYATRPDLAAKLIKYAEWHDLRFNMNIEDIAGAERDRSEERSGK